MSDFRKLEDGIYASPQIGISDVARAKELGIGLVINNRPEDEAPDQTPGSAIETAARAAGMDYVAIPVTHAGFSEAQVKAMGEALAKADGPILAYCRSGTRSTLLWALVQAGKGRDVKEIAAAAASGGYDVSPVRQLMEMLSSDAG